MRRLAPLLPPTVQDFLHSERAALSVEAAVMLPVMAFFYVAAFGYFDAYRREAVITKATYTVGDMLSRRETTIGTSDLQGAHDLFEVLTFAEPGQTRMRFTEVRRDETNDDLQIIWTATTGDGAQAMTPARLDGIRNQIPTLLDNERIVVVEAFVDHDTIFNIGLTPRTFERLVTTRQRYAARLATDATIPAVAVN